MKTAGTAVEMATALAWKQSGLRVLKRRLGMVNAMAGTGVETAGRRPGMMWTAGNGIHSWRWH